METPAHNASSSALNRWERFKIAPESVILALICLADLGTTLFWVAYRDAAEGNPIMRYYLERFGPYAFIGAKFILFLMPLLIAEWARRLRPRFVHNALRFGVVGYIAVYALGVAHVNRNVAEAQAQARLDAYLEQPEVSQDRLRAARTTSTTGLIHAAAPAANHTIAVTAVTRS